MRRLLWGMRTEAAMAARAGADKTEDRMYGLKNERNSRRIRRFPVLLAGAAMAVVISGCGEPKEAKEARLQGIGEMEAGNYSAAIEDFETALDQSDGIVNAFELDILKYRAEAEYRLADYAAAGHTYGILCEVDEERREYYYYKAACEALAGSLDTAEADFGQAEKLAGEPSQSGKRVPGEALALTSLASAAREAQDGEKAAQYCREAISRGLSGAELFNQMGMSLMEEENYEEALSYFEEGLSLADSEMASLIRMNIGILYERQGNFAKALEVLRECAASGETTPELEKEITFLESR